MFKTIAAAVLAAGLIASPALAQGTSTTSTPMSQPAVTAKAGVKTDVQTNSKTKVSDTKAKKHVAKIKHTKHVTIASHTKHVKQAKHPTTKPKTAG